MIGKYCRAKVLNRRAIQGQVVGQSEDGECWMIKKGNGRVEKWNKALVEEIKASEASHKVREERHQTGPMRRVYGDGEI